MGVCILGAQGVLGRVGGRQLREWKPLVLVFTQHGVAVCLLKVKHSSCHTEMSVGSAISLQELRLEGKHSRKLFVSLQLWMMH